MESNVSAFIKNFVPQTTRKLRERFKQICYLPEFSAWFYLVLGRSPKIQVLLKGLTRTHEVLWELNKATQDQWSFKGAFWALEGLLIWSKCSLKVPFLAWKLASLLGFTLWVHWHTPGITSSFWIFRNQLHWEQSIYQEPVAAFWRCFRRSIPLFSRSTF